MLKDFLQKFVGLFQMNNTLKRKYEHFFYYLIIFFYININGLKLEKTNPVIFKREDYENRCFKSKQNRN